MAYSNQVGHPGSPVDLQLQTTLIRLKVSLRGMQASVMDLYLHGNLRIVLKPLLQRLPLVGGMQVSKYIGMN